LGTGQCREKACRWVGRQADQRLPPDNAENQGNDPAATPVRLAIPRKQKSDQIESDFALDSFVCRNSGRKSGIHFS
jgi:hypothetical protein